MKIAVFGSGYVGLVTGACLAEIGHSVLCVDVDSEKISQLRDGNPTVFEPGLNEYIETGLRSGRLRFDTNTKLACTDYDVIFITVGTPSSEDGSAELKYVLSVAHSIADNMQSEKLIVIKSTVPIGTHFKIKELIKKSLQDRDIKIEFDIASNPEFLRQGHAIHDFMNAPRIIIGAESEHAVTTLKNLYKPILQDNTQFISMDPASAEMSKYAANVMLATKISIMNEFSRICEKVGADIEFVREGIGSDPRIGPHSIFAGLGYGGTCFPKDVKALIKIGEDIGEKLEIVTAVDRTNRLQRQNFISKIIDKASSIRAEKVAVWGLAFKPETDDIREAPSLDLIAELLKSGLTVNCFDPVANLNVLRHFHGNRNLFFFNNPYEALEKVDLLVIPTEWDNFKKPDFDKMKKAMNGRVIFDGRNIYNSEQIESFGFEYYSIGRPR